MRTGVLLAGWIVLTTACGRPAIVEAPLAPTGASAQEVPRAVSPNPERSQRPVAPEDDDVGIEEQILRSVREISPTEHVVSARAVDLFFENQATLMSGVRVVPEGKSLRIFGVRQDQLLGRLGFENGDRLESLMGKPMASAEQALEAYAAMRGASVVDMVVMRRGGTTKLVLRVER